LIYSPETDVCFDWSITFQHQPLLLALCTKY